MISLLIPVARLVVMLSMQEVWVLICVVPIGVGTGEMTVVVLGNTMGLDNGT